MISRRDTALLLDILTLGRQLPAGMGDAWRTLSGTAGLGRLVQYEGAELWLYRRLRELGLDSAPEFAGSLRRAVHRDTFRGVRIDEEARAVLTLFRDAGIPCVLIKGQARRAAVALYPWGNARTSSDVDLLLPADRAQEGWQLLLGEGYSLVGDLPFHTQHHLRPLWNERKVAVEIHTSTSRHVAPDEAWRRATDGAEEMPWSGLIVRVPSATELLWQGMAHALHEGVSATRLRSLLVGVSILASGREIGWDRIESRIRSGEARSGTAQAPIPPSLQYGWLRAAAALGGTDLPAHHHADRPLPVGALLHWRRITLDVRVGRGARGRLLEEAERAELGWPLTPSPEGAPLPQRARRAVASVIARGCYRAWRTLHRRDR